MESGDGEVRSCPEPVTRAWKLILANRAQQIFGTCEYHNNSFGFGTDVELCELDRASGSCEANVQDTVDGVCGDWHACGKPAVRHVHITLATSVEINYHACIQHENDFGFTVQVHLIDLPTKEDTV